jgi:predicted RecB family nuclease
MDTNNLITAAVFSAFLKCPTKAYLLMTGGTTSETFFADIEARISAMYTAAAQQRPHSGAAKPLAFDQIAYGLECETSQRYVDCRTAVYDIAVAPKPKRYRAQKSSPSGTFRPVVFSPWDKLELSDNLLVCFGALALSQVTEVLADTGSLIYGDGRRHKTVEIGDYVTRTHRSIDAISAICRNQEPPPLVLNKHCAVCDFQPRCRGVAIDRDDLSLLTAMTSKERTKCSAKGISTITQLSYGYRPRWRKRKKPDADSAARRRAPIAKNDYKLKALAIKKRQIHVVGTPPLKFEGTPVFLDVEGMPDRDFYYLVGLRYERAGEHVEQSFWADGPEDEREIWESCLRAIKGIGNVQIVSYGSYEKRFLKQMKERYIQVPDDAELLDRLIETSVNLVGCIYGKVYFPTLSNSLKEVGPYLGFQWAWRQASGAAAPLMRRCWELGSDDGVKGDLIGYNMDDCRAAATVADALMRICTGASDVDVVSVGSLEVAFEQTWGEFDSALPEFEEINNAAYWDYQRDRIYIRSNSSLRKSARRKHKDNRRAVRINARVDASRPCNCPTCNSRRISMTGRHSRTLYDMRFFEGGVRRWVTLHIFDHY